MRALIGALFVSRSLEYPLPYPTTLYDLFDALIHLWNTLAEAVARTHPRDIYYKVVG